MKSSCKAANGSCRRPGIATTLFSSHLYVLVEKMFTNFMQCMHYAHHKNSVAIDNNNKGLWPTLHSYTINGCVLN